MARRPALVPNTPLNTRISPDLRVKMDLLLFSTLEGRVPKGAYQTFLEARIREFFELKALDLAPYTGQPQGTFIVRGQPVVIEALEATLSTPKEGWFP